MPIHEAWNVPFLINRQFRDVLKATLPYMDLYNQFLDDIAVGGEEAIAILTRCDRNVVDEFQVEADRELTLSRICSTL